MGQELKLILFTLGDEEYGVEVDNVRMIEQMQPITSVPKTLNFIKGVINLRGMATPVIDLRGRFGYPETEYTDNTRIIIVAVEDLEVGMIVDSANDVIDVDIDHIDKTVLGVKEKYLRGIAKLESRLLVLLNLQEILVKDEIAQLKKFEE